MRQIQWKERGNPWGYGGNGEQGTVGSEQWAVSSGQWAVSSEQWSGISMLMYNALHITQLVI